MEYDTPGFVCALTNGLRDWPSAIDDFRFHCIGRQSGVLSHLYKSVYFESRGTSIGM